jgi:hypothetical protein
LRRTRRPMLLRPGALEDPSGRRLRRMRWIGRGIAVMFLLWFVVILLGALGVGPAGRLPLSTALRPSAGPPPLRRVPTPQAPSPSDLLPALPAPAVAPRITRRSPTAGQLNRHHPVRGHSASAPGHATATTPGRSASAPGHVTTAPGRSSTTFGHVSTHGAFAPGRLRRETTTTVTTAATRTIVTTTTTTTVPGRGRGTAKRH